MQGMRDEELLRGSVYLDAILFCLLWEKKVDGM